MTNDEAKQAFLSQCPVVDVRDNVIYKCISVIGFKMIQGRPVMFCECQDRKTRSVTSALPQHIEYMKEEDLP